MHLQPNVIANYTTRGLIRWRASAPSQLLNGRPTSHETRVAQTQTTSLTSEVYFNHTLSVNMSVKVTLRLCSFTFPLCILTHVTGRHSLLLLPVSHQKIEVEGPLI